MLDLRVSPTSCHYFWRAIGQQFDFFGTNVEDQIAQIENGESIDQFGYTQRTAIDLLKAWILNLDIDDPGVFIFISNYLKDRGDLNGSRMWLEVAKRETYTPNGDDPLWRRAGDRVVYAALWPAGFGAKPERVIWFMFALWIVGTVVYTLHHRGWINGAAEFLRRVRDPRPFELVYDQSDGGHLPRSGAQEPPRKPPPAPSIFVEPGRVVRAAAAEARAERQKWNERRVALASSGPPADSNLTDKLGFVTTSSDRTARRFSLWSYALDVTLPIIPLGRFGVYSADNAFVRGFSYLHHILGWWLGALFIGALTIL